MNQVAALDEFVSVILRNLEKNGFPDKSVAFPLEKMYESASQKGFSFNKVRDILKQKGIETELTTERVVFRSAPVDEADFDVQEMAAAAQQILQAMGPEEQARLSQMMQSMDADQLKGMQQQWEAMPADEKKRLMEQMKGMRFPA